MASRIIILLLCMASALLADTRSEVTRLFQQASSGEIRFTKLVQPSKDSLSAMKDSAAKYLVERLTTTDAREALTLVDIFRGMGRVATPYLVAALKTDDKYQLRTTCRSLADIKDSTAISDLLITATNSDYTVRAEAVTAIGKSGGGANTAAKLEPFLRDSVFSVRKSAVYGLGVLKSPGSAELLVRSLYDPHFGVRLSAYDAIVSFDTLSFAQVTALIDTVKTPAVAGLAIRLAGRLRIHQVEPKVAVYLNDADPLLRGWAVWSEGRLLGRNVAPKLSELQSRETDIFVKSMITDTRAYIDTLSSHE